KPSIPEGLANAMPPCAGGNRARADRIRDGLYRMRTPTDLDLDPDLVLRFERLDVLSLVRCRPPRRSSAATCARAWRSRLRGPRSRWACEQRRRPSCRWLRARPAAGPSSPGWRWGVG